MSLIQAKITAPAAAAVCETILFSAAGSEPAGQLAGYDWNFGDGNTGSGLNLSYRYPAPGVYNVTLTVRDSAGQAGPPATQTITISPSTAPSSPSCS
ncbi:MAG: PKD domain-containing protein [Anaerolineales bacterium]|nr:PKD domain-containing protein [Anaerolineales bacterium]